MRRLQQSLNHGLAQSQAQGQIQSHHQKKKVSQSAMGSFSFRKKSQGLHQMHQGNGEGVIFNFQVPIFNQISINQFSNTELEIASLKIHCKLKIVN